MRKICVFLLLSAMLSPFSARAKVCFLPSVFGGDEYCLSDDEAAQYEGCRGFDQTVPCLPGQEQLSCTNNGKTYYMCYCRKDTYKFEDHPEYQCTEGYTEECGCAAKYVKCAPEYQYKGDGFGYCKDDPERGLLHARGVVGANGEGVCILPNGEVYYKECACEDKYSFMCRHEDGLVPPAGDEHKCVGQDGFTYYEECSCDVSEGWSPNGCADRNDACSEARAQTKRNHDGEVCSKCEEVSCENLGFINLAATYCGAAEQVTYDCERLGYVYAPEGRCPYGTNNAGEEGVRCPFDKNFMSCNFQSCYKDAETCIKANPGATACVEDIDAITTCYKVSECDAEKGYVFRGTTCEVAGCSEGYVPGVTEKYCQSLNAEWDVEKVDNEIQMSGGEICARCTCSLELDSDSDENCYYTMRAQDTTMLQFDNGEHVAVYAGQGQVSNKCCNGYFKTCKNLCVGSATLDPHQSSYNKCESCGKVYYTVTSCQPGYELKNGVCEAQACDVLNGYNENIQRVGECENNGRYKGAIGWTLDVQKDGLGGFVVSGDKSCTKCVCDTTNENGDEECPWTIENKNRDGRLDAADLCCNGKYKRCYSNAPENASADACNDAHAVQKNEYVACDYGKVCEITLCEAGYDLNDNVCVESDCPTGFDVSKHDVAACGRGNYWELLEAKDIYNNVIQRGGLTCTQCQCNAPEACIYDVATAGTAELGGLCCNGKYLTCTNTCEGFAKNDVVDKTNGGVFSEGVFEKDIRECTGCGTSKFTAVACRETNGYTLENGKCMHTGCPDEWQTGLDSCPEGYTLVEHLTHKDNGQVCKMCEPTRCADGSAINVAGCATKTASAEYWKLGSKTGKKSGDNDCFQCLTNSCSDMGGQASCDAATQNSSEVKYFDAAQSVFMTDCYLCTAKTADQKCAYKHGGNTRWRSYTAGKKCGSTADGGIGELGVFTLADNGECFACLSCQEAGAGYYSSLQAGGCPMGYECEIDKASGCYVVTSCGTGYYENDCSAAEHGNGAWNWNAIALTAPYTTPNCGSCTPKDCTGDLSTDPVCEAGRESILWSDEVFSGSKRCGKCVCSSGYAVDGNVKACGLEGGWKLNQESFTCKKCEPKTCSADYGLEEKAVNGKEGYIETEQQRKVGENANYPCYEYTAKTECDQGAWKEEQCGTSGVDGWKFASTPNGHKAGEHVCFDCEAINTECPYGSATKDQNDELLTCGVRGKKGWKVTDEFVAYKGDTACYRCEALQCEENYASDLLQCSSSTSERRISSTTRYNGDATCYTCECATPYYQSDAANCGEKGNEGGWEFRGVLSTCNYCYDKTCSSYTTATEDWKNECTGAGFYVAQRANFWLGDEQGECVRCGVKECPVNDQWISTTRENKNACGEYKKIDEAQKMGESGTDDCFKCVCNNEAGYYDTCPEGASCDQDTSKYGGCVKTLECKTGYVLENMPGFKYFATEGPYTFKAGGTTFNCYKATDCKSGASQRKDPATDNDLKDSFTWSSYQIGDIKCYYPTGCQDGYLLDTVCSEVQANLVSDFNPSFGGHVCRLCRAQTCTEKQYYEMSGATNVCPADRSCASIATICEAPDTGCQNSSSHVLLWCHTGSECKTASGFENVNDKDTSLFTYYATPNKFGKATNDSLNCVEVTGCYNAGGSYDSLQGVAGYLGVREELVALDPHDQGNRRCYTGEIYCNNEIGYYDDERGAGSCAEAFPGRVCTLDAASQCYVSGDCDRNNKYYSTKYYNGNSECQEDNVGHVCEPYGANCFMRGACNENLGYFEKDANANKSTACLERYPGRVCEYDEESQCYKRGGCDGINYFDTIPLCTAAFPGYACDEDDVIFSGCYVPVGCDNQHCGPNCETPTNACPEETYPWNVIDHAEMINSCDPMYGEGTHTCDHRAMRYKSFRCLTELGWKLKNSQDGCTEMDCNSIDYPDYPLTQCPVFWDCNSAMKYSGGTLKECFVKKNCDKDHCGPDSECVTPLNTCDASFKYLDNIPHATVAKGDNECLNITKTNDACVKVYKYKDYVCDKANGWKKDAAQTGCEKMVCADYSDYPLNEDECPANHSCSHTGKMSGGKTIQCYRVDSCDSQHCNRDASEDCNTPLHTCDASFKYLNNIPHATVDKGDNECENITKTTDTCEVVYKYKDYKCDTAGGWKKNADQTGCEAMVCADYPVSPYEKGHCPTGFRCEIVNQPSGGSTRQCEKKVACASNTCGWPVCTTPVVACSGHPYPYIQNATMTGECEKIIKDGEACTPMVKMYTSFTCNTGWKTPSTNEAKCVEKGCADYATDGFPETSCDANCYICTSKDEPTGNGTTTCWHKEDKVCTSYTGWIPAESRQLEYFTYESDSKCTGSKQTTCYRLQACNTANGWLPATDVSADIFEYDSQVSGTLECRKPKGCKAANNWFDNDKVGQYKGVYVNVNEDTKAGVSCYKVTGCAQYAYTSQPDATYFKSTKRPLDAYNNGKSCWIMTGKADNAYTTAELPKFFSYTNKTAYLNGTSTTKTYYRIENCATYAYATQPDAKYFTYTSETRKKQGGTTDITCWNVTGKGTYAYTAAQKLTRYFAYDSGKKAYLNGTSSEGTYYDVTGCAASASETSQSTTIYVVRDQTQYKGGVNTSLKCYSPESCNVGYKQATASNDFGFTCTICPVGTYNTTPGSTTCTSCGAGSYSNNQGASNDNVCLPCPAGTWSADGASSCTNCADGKWSTGSQPNGCTTPCDAGYACKNGTRTQCVAGTWAAAGSSSCTACAKGKYSTTAGGQSESVCQSCAVDTYSDTLGSTSCKPCGADKWANAGSSSCSLCSDKYKTSDLWYKEGSVPSGCYIRDTSVTSVTCGGATYHKYKLVNSNCILENARQHCYKYSKVKAADNVTYYYSPQILATGAKTDKPSGCKTWSSGAGSDNSGNGTTTKCYWNVSAAAGSDCQIATPDHCTTYSEMDNSDGQHYYYNISAFGTGWTTSKPSATHFVLQQQEGSDKKMCYLVTGCQTTSGYTAGYSSVANCGIGGSTGWNFDGQNSTATANGQQLYCGKCTAKNGCGSGYDASVTSCSDCQKFTTSGYNGNNICGKCDAFGTGWTTGKPSSTYFAYDTKTEPKSASANTTCYLVTGCKSEYTAGHSSAASCGAGGATGWTFDGSSSTAISSGGTLYCGKCTIKNGCGSGYSEAVTSCSDCQKFTTSGYKGNDKCGKCDAFGTGWATGKPSSTYFTYDTKTEPKSASANTTCYLVTGCKSEYTAGYSSVANCGGGGATGWTFDGSSSTSISSGGTLYCGKCTIKEGCSTGYSETVTSCSDCQKFTTSGYKGNQICGKCESFGTGWTTGKPSSTYFTYDTKTEKKSASENTTCYLVTDCKSGYTAGHSSATSCGAGGATGWTFDGSSTTARSNGQTFYCGKCTEKDGCTSGFSATTTSCSDCQEYTTGGYKGNQICGKCTAFGTGWTTETPSSTYFTYDTKTKKKSASSNTTCYLVTDCKSGYTAGHSSATSCGAGGATGWTFDGKSTTARSNGQTFYCGKCTEKDGCTSGFSATTTSCSDCQEYTTGGYKGNQICGKCTAFGTGWTTETPSSTYFTYDTKTKKKSASVNTTCYLVTDCKSGYTAGYSSATSCGAGGATGWTFDGKSTTARSNGQTFYCGKCTAKNGCGDGHSETVGSCNDCEEFTTSGYKGNQVCGKCTAFGTGWTTSPISTTYFAVSTKTKNKSPTAQTTCYLATGCKTGYTAGYSSATNCGAGGATGWTFDGSNTAATSNAQQLYCGKCTEKDGCAEGYSTTVTSCSDCQKFTTSGYSGNKICGKCESFGTGWTTETPSSTYFTYSTKTEKKSASENTTCYLVTDCKSGYTAGYSAVSSCGAGGATGWTFDGKSTTARSNGQTFYCGKCTEKNGCGSGYSASTTSCNDCNKFTTSGYQGNQICGKCDSFGTGWTATEPSTTYFTTTSKTEKKSATANTTCYRATGCKNAYTPGYSSVSSCGTGGSTGWTFDGQSSAATESGTTLYCGKCTSKNGCADGYSATTTGCSDCQKYTTSGYSGNQVCGKCEAFGTGWTVTEPSTTYFTTTSKTEKKSATANTTCYRATGCKTGYTSGYSSAASCGAGGSTGWTFDGSSSVATANGQQLYCGKCTAKDGCTSGFSTSIQSVDNCGTQKANGWTYSSSGYNGNTTCGKCTPKDCTGDTTKTKVADCGAGGSTGWTYTSCYYGDELRGTCTAKDGCGGGYSASVTSCGDCKTFSTSGYSGNDVCGKCDSLGTGYVRDTTSINSTYFAIQTATDSNNHTCHRATGCATSAGYVAGKKNVNDCGTAGSNGWQYVGGYTTYTNSGNTLYCGKCTANGCGTYGWLEAGQKNDTCFTYKSENKQAGDDSSHACYWRLSCNNSNGYYDSCDSNCYRCTDHNCSDPSYSGVCKTRVSKQCGAPDYPDYPLTSCPTGYVCDSVDSCLGSTGSTKCYKNTNVCKSGYCGTNCATVADACAGYSYTAIAHATMSSDSCTPKCQSNNATRYKSFTCHTGHVASGSSCVCDTAHKYYADKTTCENGNTGWNCAASTTSGATDCYVPTNCKGDYEASGGSCVPRQCSYYNSSYQNNKPSNAFTYNTITTDIGANSVCYQITGCADVTKCGASCSQSIETCPASTYPYGVGSYKGSHVNPTGTCKTVSGGGTLSCTTSSDVVRFSGYSCDSGYCKSGSAPYSACTATQTCSSYGYTESNKPANSYLTGGSCTPVSGGTNEACSTGATKYNDFACLWPATKVNGNCTYTQFYTYNYGISGICVNYDSTPLELADNLSINGAYATQNECMLFCSGGECETLGDGTWVCGCPSSAPSFNSEILISNLRMGGGCNNQNHNVSSTYVGTGRDILGQYGSLRDAGYRYIDISGSISNASTQISHGSYTGCIDAYGPAPDSTLQCNYGTITFCSDYQCNSGYCKNGTSYPSCRSTTTCSGYATGPTRHGSLSGTTCTQVNRNSTTTACYNTYKYTSYTCDSGYCKDGNSTTAKCAKTSSAPSGWYTASNMPDHAYGVGNTITWKSGSTTSQCTNNTAYQGFACSAPYVRVGTDSECLLPPASYGSCQNGHWGSYQMGLYFGYYGDQGLLDCMYYCGGGWCKLNGSRYQCYCNVASELGSVSYNTGTATNFGTVYYSKTALTYDQGVSFCSSLGKKMMRLSSWYEGLSSTEAQSFNALCNNVTGKTKNDHAWCGEGKNGSNATNVNLNAGNSGNEDISVKMCVFCQ